MIQLVVVVVAAESRRSGRVAIAARRPPPNSFLSRVFPTKKNPASIPGIANDWTALHWKEGRGKEGKKICRRRGKRTIR
jgi:hypothetical protein